MSENGAGNTASAWTKFLSLLPNFLRKGNGIEPPQLADLAKAAKPNAKQKFANYGLLGYGGNTAVSVISVFIARKFFPDLISKWEAKHEEKYFERKVKEQITPVADKLNTGSRQALEGKIREQAKAYAKDTVNSRLLVTGGFAMLPFQSAMEVSQFGENIAPKISEFREACTAKGMSEEATQEALEAAIYTQKQALGPRDKTGKTALDNALDEPKFSPLGSDARKGLPKWIIGRTAAIGAAFVVQTIVDDRFKKPKDAVDQTLAKIVTRIIHPKGYNKAPNENSSFANEISDLDKAKSDIPKDIDPKVLNVVKMVTTDAYMTTVAIMTQMASNNAWDEKISPAIDRLKNKFTRDSYNLTA